MTKLTEREVRAALAAEREYRMKVEAERDALREQVKLLREQVAEDALILDTPRMCCCCHEVTNDNVLCEVCYEDRIA